MLTAAVTLVCLPCCRVTVKEKSTDNPLRCSCAAADSRSLSGSSLFDLESMWSILLCQQGEGQESSWLPGPERAAAAVVASSAWTPLCRGCYGPRMLLKCWRWSVVTGLSKFKAWGYFIHINTRKISAFKNFELDLELFPSCRSCAGTYRWSSNKTCTLYCASQYAGEL